MKFQDFIYNLGLGHQEVISDGEIHRFKPPKSKENSGWYVSYPHFEYEAGVVGDWRTGLQENFCSINKSELTIEQKRQYTQQKTEATSQRKVEEVRRHTIARKEANKIWGETSTEDMDSHPYVIKKQIRVSNIHKNTEGDILIPIYDTDRSLWNLQTVKADGKKLFHKGGKVNGCYHPIGFLNNILPQIILCEGYSTGASIHQATGIATAVCFSANNLKSVAKSLRAKYPNTRLVIAGDDDQFNSVNIGRNKSFIAAKQVNASTIFPAFKDLSTKPTDFNDLHCLEGLDAVRKQFIGVCDVF